METPRGVVLRYLNKCEAAGQYANLALDTALSREPLSPADRRFVTALFYGVLEHRITLDAVIDARSALPPSAIERSVRQILRMALCQLLYFDRVPDHAAIDEAVELTPRRSKGFVNAVLRQFCRDGKQIPLPDPADTAAYFSVKYSVCLPLVNTFLNNLGKERTASLLAAFAHPPAITVRVNTTRLSVEEFCEKVPGAVPEEKTPHGVILPPNTELPPLLDEGLCFVQDAASQIAVAALQIEPHMRVLDTCAAPGSKSFGAAMDLEGTGEVRSFDLHQSKLSLIKTGAAKLGLERIVAEAEDARLLDRSRLGLFERVICDVPCSGFGVLAKKPDLRYKDPAETIGLHAVQRDILESAARLVAPNGVLVYSTCTLLPEENERQISAFLERHPEFSLEPFMVFTPYDKEDIRCDGMLTLAPDTHGTDGFFVAKLRRNEFFFV